MASRSKLTKADRIRDRQQQMDALNAQQAHAKVDAILVSTASAVYASLVAKAWDGDETLMPDEIFRKLAFIAKSSIPFFGQALGMLNPPPDIRVVEVPKPDEVIEIPESPVADTESPVVSVESPVEPPVVSIESPVMATESPVVVVESPVVDQAGPETSTVTSGSSVVVLESSVTTEKSTTE